MYSVTAVQRKIHGLKSIFAIHYKDTERKPDFYLNSMM